MKKITTINTKIIALLLAVFFVLINGGLTLLTLLPQKSLIAETLPNEVSLSNSNFTNPTSGNFPRTPSNWTVLNSTNATNVKSGVINLEQTSFETNMADKYNLDFKPYDYEAMDDTYVLLINSKNASSYYGYKSKSISLEANSYYSISVMAYTKSGSGTVGTFKLTGDDIDTADQNSKITLNTNGNWTKYTFYVQTNTLNSLSVYIELWLGEENLIKSSGAVFYDDVEIYKLSSSLYETQVNNAITGNHQVLSFKDTAVDSVTNPNFENGLTGWTIKTINDGSVVSGSLISGVYNIDESFNSTLTQVETNPSTNGVYNNHKALLINNLESGSYGYESTDFEIEQYKLYRLSVSVYTNALNGSAEIKLIEESPYEETSYEPQTFTISSVSTSSSWATYSFYIKGNSFTDTVVTLELWLGSETKSASGYAFFDNVLLEEITSTSYSSGSSGTNVSKADLNQNATTPDVANGAFNFVNIVDTESVMPYEPSSWTLTTTESNSTRNGIINTSKNLSSLSISNPGAVNGGFTNNNILMIGNLGSNYQYYSSESLTLSASSYYKISATIQTQGLVGAYASVRLVGTNNVVLGEIANISSSGWQTYTFFVKTGYNTQSLSIQLGLGANSEGIGYAFFDNIRSLSSAEDEYNTTSSYSKKVNLSVMDFTNVKADQQNGLLTPFDFVASNTSNADLNYVDAGILNTNSYSYPNEYFPDMENPLSPNGTSGYVLMIHSGEDANYSYSSSRTFALTSGTYYKISVWVKTNGLTQNIANKQQSNSSTTEPEYYPYGATVSISDLDASFTGIDTENQYKQYTFYINCTESASVTINLGLGNSNALTSGYVFFSDVEISTITEDDYVDNIAILEDDDTITNIMAVGETSTEDEEETTDDAVNFDWLLLPTLITSIAIIVAVIGFGIRNINIKRPTKVGKSEYDREKSLQIEQEHRDALKEKERKLQELKEQLENVKKSIFESKKEFKQSISRTKLSSVTNAIKEEDKKGLNQKELALLKKQKSLEYKTERRKAYEINRQQLIEKYNALNLEIEAIYQEELRLIKEYKEYRRQVRIKRQEIRLAKKKKTNKK